LGIARRPWCSHGARRLHRGAGASRADSKEAGGVMTVMQREGSPVAATAMVIEAGGEEAGGGSWPVHVLLRILTVRHMQFHDFSWCLSF
jgi:hypothetical protein